MAKAELIGSFFRSLTGRMMLGALLIHAILIPLLFAVILRMVQQDYKEQFINYARAQAHTLASLLEQIPERSWVEQIINDQTLTGEVLYAEFLSTANTLLPHNFPRPLALPGADSSIPPPPNGVGPFEEDFFFGQHDDHVYFIAIPVAGPTPESRGMLRLGYDELPVLEHIKTLYRFNIYLAAAYLGLSLLFIFFFGHRLTKSIRLLRDASRRIADGHTNEQLSVNTKVTEVYGLAQALETMRQGLIKQERIAREHEVALSEARYFLMTEYSSDMVVQLSPSGILDYISPASTNLLGYEPETLRGHSLFMLIHPDDVQAVCLAIMIVLRNRTLDTITIRLKNREGNYLWLETSLRGLSGQTPQDPGHIIAISHDVTERVQTVENLNRFKHILDSTLDMLFMCEPDTLRFVYLNKGMAECMGYAREELLQMTIDQIMPRITEREFGNLIAPLLSGAQVSLNFETIQRRKNGNDFPVEIFLQLVKEDKEKGLFVVTVRDITARRAAEQHIMHLASHDALTGLPNRNLLQDRIRQAITQARRNIAQGAVLFIDLDHFKGINDSLGHDMGDLLLKEVAQRITAGLRIEDTVARQGGDEFIVVLSSVASDLDAGAVAHKLLADLTAPYYINEKELYISASIGIAVFPHDGNDVDTLLKNSDTAMYHAKASGRNNCQFFAPEMNQFAAEWQSLGTDLRHALERNELLLHFQPLIDVHTSKLISLEVLVRWQHPEKGLISPLKFIPLAEDNGLIMPIGEWVLRTACEQLKLWHALGIDVPRLAINLSAKQFRQKTLAQTVTRILDETGIAPRFVELEITESLLMEKTDEVIQTLRQLSDIGLGISIDDFGTGYSSLSYLKRFPIDTLKIDRSFVMDIATDPDDAAIVTAIISMAHSLQMQVIAEGVETAEQLAFLRKHGCDVYQGFYFSDPLAAAEVEAMLDRPHACH
jgi:diguanylate cyclase (GGDEF)-like protein/PAS domain S-box-containing protein